MRGGFRASTVSDRGIGIDPRDQGRIFERFEQVAHGDSAGGLGVGLWIVHEIVAAMEGTIEVASAPGQGTRFTVRLPMRGPAPNAPS